MEQFDVTVLNSLGSLCDGCFYQFKNWKEESLPLKIPVVEVGIFHAVFNFVLVIKILNFGIMVLSKYVDFSDGREAASWPE